MGSDDSDVEKHERVLAPDDLDITKQPEVEEIDDGRYVVSSNGPAKKPDRELLENPDWLNDDPDEADDKPANRQSTNSSRQQPTTQNQPANSQSEPNPTTQSTPPAQNSTQPPEQSTPPDTTTSSAESQPSTKRSQPPADGTPSTNQPQQGSQRSQNTQTQNRTTQSTPQDGAAQSTPQNRTTQSTSANTQSEPTPTNTRTDKPTNRELAAHDQPPAEPPAAEITNENVSKFLAQSLANASGDYGFDATLNVEGSVNRGRMTSDDIGETLETLLRWYARQTTDEVDPEHVLGIILAGSDLAVEYPVQSAYEVVKQHGLGPDDSISDLLAAVREEGSFTVPPSKD